MDWPLFCYLALTKLAAFVTLQVGVIASMSLNFATFIAPGFLGILWRSAGNSLKPVVVCMRTKILKFSLENIDFFKKKPQVF